VIKDQRYTITWDVPQSELEEALNTQGTTHLYSTAVYAAGCVWRLQLIVKEAQGSQPRDIGVFFSPSSYKCQGQEVVPENEVTQVKYTLTHQPPGGARHSTLAEYSLTLQCALGLAQAFKASSMADLQPHLCDGCLKLRATFQVIH
jgi:hypothetical protein